VAGCSKRALRHEHLRSRLELDRRPRLVRDQTVDFASSDFTYGDVGLSPPKQPFEYIPNVGYGESLVYNVKGSNGKRIKDLILNPETIGLAFTGAITRWDDPAIAALNPQALLPDAKNFRPVPITGSGGQRDAQRLPAR
jgi:ABC-type phosphate transport system substrate-binding protein